MKRHIARVNTIAPAIREVMIGHKVKGAFENPFEIDLVIAKTWGSSKIEHIKKQPRFNTRHVWSKRLQSYFKKTLLTPWNSTIRFDISKTWIYPKWKLHFLTTSYLKIILNATLWFAIDQEFQSLRARAKPGRIFNKVDHPLYWQRLCRLPRLLKSEDS